MRSRLYVAAFVAALALTACSSSEGPRPPDPSDGPAGARADGAELLYRGKGHTSAQNPAFSPDGASVLFTLFAGGYNEGAAALRVLSLRDGAQSRPGTLLDESDRAAVNLPGSSWHPSAGVAFASDRAGGRDEVWVMPPGGRPSRVTEHGGDSGYLEPSFSPDGAWIVFQESRESGTEKKEKEKEKESAEPAEPADGGGALGSLWKVRRDGSGRTRLLDGPATGTDNRQPNWSPKGDRLVFQRRERGSHDWALYVMNADGSGLRRLTGGPGEHTDPSWSPDGRQVVFSSTAGGLEVPQIFAIPADGGRPVRVTRNDGSYDGAPSWSPDGRWIAFESHPGEEDRPTALWRIPAPGTDGP
ncbi:PD40 domain-containing protein [Streptomyces telluris]|uniref:PD40 domain-containing protein n=1 Tax=Streptomyces telluris TaxID=2720021 RepID=A0A9X2LGK3_9ACTN|nr:PD40 domain-containing protein [Streptomyces telluris]MCQ8770574.1 PD40 domain-containing protein [Streptomyces telluris]NJP81792.1 hypothetical protein [Streptomyces telluris]